MTASPEHDGWILRVLGIDLKTERLSGADDLGVTEESLVALFEKAAKLVGAERPDGPAKSTTSNRLLEIAMTNKAPDDPLAMSGHLAKFVPGFLATIESERPVTSKPLEPGEKLGGQDQILGLADFFAAAQRSLIRWERLLDETEQANSELDRLESATPRDEDDYLGMLATYNRLRTDSLHAQSEALPLLASLKEKYDSLSADQQQIAQKDATHG